MKIKKFDFTKFFVEAKKSDIYWVEGAIIEFTEEIVRLMKLRGVNRVELARRLNASPAYVTKLLRGDNNFTLETMVKVSRALGSELQLHLQPDGTITKWFDVVKSEMKRSRKKRPIQGTFKLDKAVPTELSLVIDDELDEELKKEPVDATLSIAT